MQHIEGGFHIRAVILAAGQGKRLNPLTKELPKALIHCAGKTLLGRLIENLESAAPIEINIGLGWKADLIRVYVQTQYPDSNINFIDVPDYEVGPLETLVTTVGVVDEPVIICPVDFVAETGFFQEMIEKHLSESKRFVTIAIDSFKEKGTKLTFSDSGTLLGFNDIQSELGNSGQSAMILIAQPEFFDTCRERRDQGRTLVRDVLIDILEKGDTIHTWHVNGNWFDIDTISDVLHANRVLLAKEPPEVHGIYI
ncbi:MAG: NTP transferase domain-containing protein, partial [Candidatus Thorarchaeota archaeon]